MTDLDAAHRLAQAVDQLALPTRIALDRYRPEADPATAATLAEADQQHADAMDQHRSRYRRATTAGNVAGQRAALRALIAAEKLHKARAAERELAITAAEAEAPCLLDQLADAVESSSSRGGPAGAGAHRSPLGLEAAELLGEIRRTVGHRGDTGLVAAVRAWAESPSADADAAQRWASRAAEIVSPSRSFEIRGACPLCGRRRVWVADETGTRVLRAAIQVSYATRSARCIGPGCSGSWSEHYLSHLASVVQQDRDERAG